MDYGLLLFSQTAKLSKNYIENTSYRYLKTFHLDAKYRNHILHNPHGNQIRPESTKFKFVMSSAELFDGLIVH